MAALKTARIFFDPSEALVVWSMLDAYGLNARLSPWHHYTLNPWMTIAFGGIVLNVPYHELGNVQSLLNLREETAIEQCPACGSFEFVRLAPISRAIYVILLGIATTTNEKSLRSCLKCQHKWRKRPTSLLTHIGFLLILLIVLPVIPAWISMYY